MFHFWETPLVSDTPLEGLHCLDKPRHLGISTCFYDGMDKYAEAYHHFAARLVRPGLYRSRVLDALEYFFLSDESGGKVMITKEVTF